MQKHSALIALVSTLDRSLRQLDYVMQERPSAIIRPILKRRRRAVVMLKSLIKNDNNAMMETAGHEDKPLPTSFYALWHTEKRLLDLYDGALVVTPVRSPEASLLCAQRAETEQAYLAIVNAIRNWTLVPVPDPVPVHWSA